MDRKVYFKQNDRILWWWRSWQKHPFVLNFHFAWIEKYISSKMTEFYDDDCSFEHVTGCRFIKLYISMFEKWLSVTAMAGSGEQMRSVHACDVSLGARIVTDLGWSQWEVAIDSWGCAKWQSTIWVLKVNDDTMFPHVWHWGKCAECV